MLARVARELELVVGALAVYLEQGGQSLYVAAMLGRGQKVAEREQPIRVCTVGGKTPIPPVLQW